MSNRVDFDNYTENYNKLLHEETRFFSSSDAYFAQYKVDIVRKQVQSPVSRLLEYGCGIGRNMPFLRQAFPDALVTGSDISAASLELARHGNPDVQFIHEDGTASLIGEFDMIFVACVYHHIPINQRQDVTRILFERLVPGGSLFVFEHNPFNPVTRRIVNTCRYDEDAILLKPSEMKRYLQQTGFSGENQSYCLFLPPRFSWLSFLESRLCWLPLGGQYWVQAKRPL
ncbi:MAG: class I SAM-dependent methyltransferase [Proteobacteria bacterium]|nr:class I SAM-dependent methyltransferase [Pseudomonadota bacterium]